jgi:serine/threonine protein kinase
LAATAFRLLTGESPFRESNPVAVISQHLHAPAPRVSTRRGELAPVDPVLMKPMSKDPRDRFATCSEFAQAFAEQAGMATTPLVMPHGWPAVAQQNPAHTLPWVTPVPPGPPPRPPAGMHPGPPPGPPPGLVSNQMAFAPPPSGPPRRPPRRPRCLRRRWSARPATTRPSRPTSRRTASRRSRSTAATPRPRPSSCRYQRAGATPETSRRTSRTRRWSTTATTLRTPAR